MANLAANKMGSRIMVRDCSAGIVLRHAGAEPILVLIDKSRPRSENAARAGHAKCMRRCEAKTNGQEPLDHQ